ncbi:hypothetical protein SME38J_05090 [Serratia marcescens]|nr:hypothetical protein SME38J_05090 [Serratia marcescens]
MAILTFDYPARVNAAGDMQFRLRKAQFGDGYTQVAGEGLNPVTRSWDLSFVGNEAYISAIISFFESLQGYRAFQWTPPNNVTGLYRCEGYKPTALGGNNYSLTATFIEAYHA